jgi:hypothetical protein
MLLINGTEKVVYPGAVREIGSIADDQYHTGSPKVWQKSVSEICVLTKDPLATHNKTNVANDKMTPPMRCLSAFVKKPAMPLTPRVPNGNASF